jgi:hypothetical protein
MNCEVMEPNDDLLFDRLVDGELPPSERRELLASLDVRPDGWRHCALAFLEAQTWRQELPRLVADATSPSPVTALEDVPLEPAWSMNWYALAASLLFAFTLGLALRDLPHSHQVRAPNPSNIATVRPQQPAFGPRQFAGAGPATAALGDAVTLWVRDEAGNARQLRVPLVDATAMDQHLGLEFQSGLPADVRSQLEQRGYQVESKRRYAPLVLEGGRPLVVPVEDTKIVPVSNPVY